MKIEYSKASWRPGSDHVVDAEVAHQEIERLRGRNGGKLTCEQLVKAASARRNPLHREFEWDDTKAAHQFRLRQAREILNGLVVFHDPEKKVSSRVYDGLFIATPERMRHIKQYRPLSELLSDPETRDVLLQRALGELTRIQKAYRNLEELAQVFLEVEKAKRKVKPTRKRELVETS